MGRMREANVTDSGSGLGTTDTRDPLEQGY